MAGFLRFNPEAPRLLPETSDRGEAYEALISRAAIGQALYLWVSLGRFREAHYVGEMKLTSKIARYSLDWPAHFLRPRPRALRLCSACTVLLCTMLAARAVTGLAAKPEIDILVVVRHGDDLGQWTRSLMKLGYRRGRDLSEGHAFFKRDVGQVRTHKLHICYEGHPQIGRMLGLRDHLRSNEEDRTAYEALKFRLEAENLSGIAEYLAAKAPFLDALFRKIGASAPRDCA